MPLTLSGTNGVSGVDGTASNPALQGGTSTTAGVVYPAADTVAIATASTERLRVDSSGRVGIGTASPTSKLYVSGTGSQTLSIERTDAATAGVLQIIAGNNTNVIASTTAKAFSYEINGAEAMRLDTSGNLLVGTTSQVQSGRVCFSFDGAAYNAIVLNDTNTTTNIAYMYFSRGGSTKGSITYNSTAVAYNTSSDYRLKENIQPMSGAIDKVLQLKPVTYTWKENGSDGQGFIAHELQAIVPDAVTGEKDAVDANGNPVYQGVDTSFLVATLTAAIQELSAKLDAAEARIAALEAK